MSKYYSQIHMLVPPTEATHIVTKKYVDLAVNRKLKDAVRCVTGENIDLSSPVTTVDGLTIQENDRILLIGQTDATENGIYVADDSLNLTRAEDFNASEKIPLNVIIPVMAGSQADLNYQLINDEPVVLGTSSLMFARFKGDADVHSYNGEFVGNGTDTEFVVTHGLGSKNIVVRIVDELDNECHFTTVATSDNTLTVTSDVVLEDEAKFKVTVLA